MTGVQTCALPISQFNASQYLVGVTRYQRHLTDGKPTVWEIFEQHTRTPAGKVGKLDSHDAVRSVANIRGGGKIDLIPSRLELALSLKNPGHKADLLQRSLRGLEDEYDLVLIDCAPTESILTTAAYLASQYILVPVKPEYLSTIGLPLLVNSMEDYLQQYDEAKLELAGVVFNGTSEYSPEETKSKAEVKKMAAANGWYVFSSEINYSRSYPKGAREGQPIFRTSYARTTAAANFRSFADEFAGKIGL